MDRDAEALVQKHYTLMNIYYLIKYKAFKNTIYLAGMGKSKYRLCTQRDKASVFQTPYTAGIVVANYCNLNSFKQSDFQIIKIIEETWVPIV